MNEPNGLLRRSLFVEFSLIFIAASAWAITRWPSSKSVGPRVIAVSPFKPIVAAGAAARRSWRRRDA